MKKTRIHILFLFTVLLIFTSCEDMFYHEIDFKGETEPEMLVINGNFYVDEVPPVFVSHSFFFDRNDKSINDWVTDANVTMRVNGTAYAMKYNNRSEGLYFSTLVPPFQPLDTIELIATHPNYETATAKQIMPAQVKSSISAVESLPNGTISCILNLESYSGNADDVIGIRANGELKSTWTNPSTGNTSTNTVCLSTVYSNDIVFAEADNASREGYFGATSDDYLYFPASELKEPRQIQIIIDSQWLRVGRYDSLEAISMEVEVTACSYSGYRFVQSTRSPYYAKYMPAPSWLPEQDENIMEEIMDAIKETLGDQEPVLVYSNIEGGLGHVASFCTNLLRYDF